MIDGLSRNIGGTTKRCFITQAAPIPRSRATQSLNAIYNKKKHQLLVLNPCIIVYIKTRHLCAARATAPSKSPDSPPLLFASGTDNSATPAASSTIRNRRAVDQTQRSRYQHALRLQAAHHIHHGTGGVNKRRRQVTGATHDVTAFRGSHAGASFGKTVISNFRKIGTASKPRHE